MTAINYGFARLKIELQQKNDLTPVFFGAKFVLLNVPVIKRLEMCAQNYISR